MTALHAAVLGLVQGATEFLPVSSSGHLILVPWLLGWPDQGLAFDAAVHLGTVLAPPHLLRGEIGRPHERSHGRAPVGAPAGHWPWCSPIPAGVAGLALEQVIQTRLRSTTVVAWSTILWALVLWWADRRAAQGGECTTCATSGSAGHSRSAWPRRSPWSPARRGPGSPFGRALRRTRPVDGSHLRVPPGPARDDRGGAPTLALARAELTGNDLAVLAVGIGTSFAAGLAAIRFLVAYLRRRTLLVFVVYRIVLGVVLLWLGRG